MKIASFIWNYRIVGRTEPISYYGVRTKTEAVAFAEDWNSRHDLKVEVIKFVNGKWEVVND